MSSPAFRPFSAPCASALLAALALTACADERSGYPSLAPRPVEREVLKADPVPPAPDSTPAPLPASADVSAVVAQAEEADAAFRAALAKDGAGIAAGLRQEAGSDAWIAAQQSYSSLDSSRAAVADALAELDRRREAAVTAGNVAAADAITEAAVRLQATYDAERAALDALMLSGS
ncbi:hypothetical protein [Rhizorhabdus phycosphaerae]|uniref:hypothetical protein n=1 Tax=Rhizorhabdus phycosphaerae TaxID=2711156 RepID=UPI0013EA7384|nr:hypothetical protein [Rhizorhabdus phycosphaerae]